MGKPVLDDVLEKNMKVAFVGTAVGKKSEKEKAYYAQPRNRFWEIIHKAGFTGEQLKPNQYKELRGLKIGLTDIVKDGSGTDKEIEKQFKDRSEKYIGEFAKKIREHKPGIVAFNGKTAGRWVYNKARTSQIEYGKQKTVPECLKGADVEVHVLPSTSPAARGYWDEKYWKGLGKRNYGK